MKKIITVLLLLMILVGCQKNTEVVNWQTPVIEQKVSDELIEQSYFLPIGSVVKLKGRDFLVIIQGIIVSDEDGKQYPFIGSPYPQGHIAGEELIFFDEKELEQVLFMGYITQEHKEIEFALYQFEEKFNDIVFLSKGYVGLSRYAQDVITEEESNAIKESDYFPVGTTFMYDEKTFLVVVGYHPSREMDGEQIYYCVQTPRGIETYSGYKLGGILSKDLKGLKVVREGFKDETYYQWIEEIDEVINNVGVNVLPPTPTEEVVIENPVTYILSITGIDSEVTLYHENGIILKQVTKNIMPYNELIKKEVALNSKEDVQEWFSQSVEPFEGIKGLKHSVEYTENEVIENIEIDYEIVDFNKMESLPGHIGDKVTDEGVKVGLLRMVDLLESLGYEKAE